LERILKSSSIPGDLVFDFFMGSGTTQAVAMKLGRRFIGADINLGSIQTTTKRLCTIQKEIESTLDKEDKFTGFEVYNVNNYDFFQNPVQAKELLIEALEMLKQSKGNKSLSQLPQIFTDFKRDEIVSIFSGQGTSQDREKIYDILFNINPSQNSYWEKIKQ